VPDFSFNGYRAAMTSIDGHRGQVLPPSGAGIAEAAGFAGDGAADAGNSATNSRR
jgi:hypothetical protein